MRAMYRTWLYVEFFSKWVAIPVLLSPVLGFLLTLIVKDPKYSFKDNLVGSCVVSGGLIFIIAIVIFFSQLQKGNQI